MEEKDFQRIEQMTGKAVKEEVGNAVKSEIITFRHEIDAKLGQLRKGVNEDFRHHVGILTENFHHKLQLVAEGHQKSTAWPRMLPLTGQTQKGIKKDT